jgi:large subunit ribosomal protein L18
MKLTRAERRERNHLRVRRKVVGTSDRPRLCIRKTSRHLYVEIVDDTPPQGCRVLLAATTNTKAAKAEKKNFANKESARKLGGALADQAKAKGISVVVFDRGGNIYHGVVKELAEACRKAGLKF